MSLEGRQELRAARQRFLGATDEIGERLATIGTRLAYLSLVLAFALTLLVGGLAWQIVGSDSKTANLQPPVVVTVVQGQAIAIPGWRSEETCFTTPLVFLSGKTTCEGAQPTCDWGTFQAGGRSIEGFLRDVRPGALGIVRVFAGHDTKRVRHGSPLDSNLDLAHQRAALVADAIKLMLPGGDKSWLVIPEAGSYPPPCGPAAGVVSDPQRRQPVLSVTIWEPDHD